MEIVLRNKTYIRLDNKAQYKFSRYMVTIRQRSGHYTEHEYCIVSRNGRMYFVLDGLYYRVFDVGGIITIELSEGSIELIDERILAQI